MLRFTFHVALHVALHISCSFHVVFIYHVAIHMNIDSHMLEPSVKSKISKSTTSAPYVTNTLTQVHHLSMPSQVHHMVTLTRPWPDLDLSLSVLISWRWPWTCRGFSTRSYTTHYNFHFPFRYAWHYFHYDITM